MKRGIGFLVAAQFVSGLADSALLIVAMAWLKETGQNMWLAPLLKAMFTLAYVGLAPAVGAIADRWPKGRVMFAANALKALGCVLIASGVDPLLAFAIAGVGAAVYSPAKYGLMAELAPTDRLVHANGWLEVTTVGAIVLGTMLGGGLVGPLLAWELVRELGAWLPVDSPLSVALMMVLTLYVVAAALNWVIPASGAQLRAMQLSLGELMERFVRAQGVLWRDPLAGISLGVTTLFWGAGATLQFVVLAWAQQELGLSLSGAAYLQGLVAVGIGLGALAAGRWVTLEQAPQLLGLGVLIGLVVPMMTFVQSVMVAAPLMVVVGALTGFLVVPMNALLQHRGQVLLGGRPSCNSDRPLGSGESIAVQNFSENLCVLAMLGAYAGLQVAGWPLHQLALLLGVFVAGGVALLMWQYRKACVSVTYSGQGVRWVQPDPERPLKEKQP
ncbi:lysophospholipid transporter LplT [Ottowia thiooxydans]|uniref:lysophospholipid transporter LplT n=1 Tax=Ottowia thiooxydans TaxID=219182 RepID=UPI0003FA37A1|nr:lysophospholipid transporter LplT [Ottowia thiooxydans]